MATKQSLLKLAEKIDALIEGLEKTQEAEKVAEEKVAQAAVSESASLGRIGTVPARGTNPLMDFIMG